MFNLVYTCILGCLHVSLGEQTTTANEDENVAKRKILMCRAKAMHVRYKSFDRH